MCLLVIRCSVLPPSHRSLQPLRSSDQGVPALIYLVKMLHRFHCGHVDHRSQWPMTFKLKTPPRGQPRGIRHVLWYTHIHHILSFDFSPFLQNQPFCCSHTLFNSSDLVQFIDPKTELENLSASQDNTSRGPIMEAVSEELCTVHTAWPAHGHKAPCQVPVFFILFTFLMQIQMSAPVFLSL